MGEEGLPHAELKFMHHVNDQHLRNVEPFTQTFPKRILDPSVGTGYLINKLFTNHSRDRGGCLQEPFDSNTGD